MNRGTRNVNPRSSFAFTSSSGTGRGSSTQPFSYLHANPTTSSHLNPRPVMPVVNRNSNITNIRRPLGKINTQSDTQNLGVGSLINPTLTPKPNPNIIRRRSTINPSQVPLNTQTQNNFNPFAAPSLNINTQVNLNDNSSQIRKDVPQQEPVQVDDDDDDDQEVEYEKENKKQILDNQGEDFNNEEDAEEEEDNDDDDEYEEDDDDDDEDFSVENKGVFPNNDSMIISSPVPVDMSIISVDLSAIADDDHLSSGSPSNLNTSSNQNNDDSLDDSHSDSNLNLSVEIGGDIRGLMDDIFEHLRARESSTMYRLRCNFMSQQTDIHEKMRCLLVDWLVDVHYKFDLRPETLFLAINILDRMLQLRPISKKKLQLVGIICLEIASKYEEIYPPTIQDYQAICANAYPREDLIKMERVILQSLDFNLTAPTPFVFVRRFLTYNEFANQYQEKLFLTQQEDSDLNSNHPKQREKEDYLKVLREFELSLIDDLEENQEREKGMVTNSNSAYKQQQEKNKNKKALKMGICFYLTELALLDYSTASILPSLISAASLLIANIIVDYLQHDNAGRTFDLVYSEPSSNSNSDTNMNLNSNSDPSPFSPFTNNRSVPQPNSNPVLESVWSWILVQYTQYSLSSLLPTVSVLVSLALKAPPGKYQASVRKYSRTMGHGLIPIPTKDIYDNIDTKRPLPSNSQQQQQQYPLGHQKD